MGNIGTIELVIIILVLLVLLGSKKLSELARGLGEIKKEYEDALSGIVKEKQKNDKKGNA